MKTTERVVDLEGDRFVAMVRHQDGGEVSYSFDGGAGWWPTMADGYTAAKRAGTLVPYRELDEGGGGEFEAWVLTLLAEIKDMAEGETLKVTRHGGRFLLRREKVVGVVSASAFREVDLRLEEEDPRGSGGRAPVQGRGRSGGRDPGDGGGEAGRDDPPS